MSTVHFVCVFLGSDADYLNSICKNMAEHIRFWKLVEKATPGMYPAGFHFMHGFFNVPWSVLASFLLMRVNIPCIPRTFFDFGQVGYFQAYAALNRYQDALAVTLPGETVVVHDFHYNMAHHLFGHLDRILAQFRKSGKPILLFLGQGPERRFRGGFVVLANVVINGKPLSVLLQEAKEAFLAKWRPEDRDGGMLYGIDEAFLEYLFATHRPLVFVITQNQFRPCHNGRDFTANHSPRKDTAAVERRNKAPAQRVEPDTFHLTW